MKPGEEIIQISRADWEETQKQLRFLLNKTRRLDEEIADILTLIKTTTTPEAREAVYQHEADYEARERANEKARLAIERGKRSNEPPNHR